MAGIVAVSATADNIGDTAPDKNLSGYVTREKITLSTDPTGSSYRWSITRPRGSSRSSLSRPNSASPTFKPDVTGYYVITVVVDESTTYVVRIAATETSTGFVGALNYLSLADATVNTPRVGTTVYHSEDEDDLSFRLNDGTTRRLSALGSSGATIVADVSALRALTISEGALAITEDTAGTWLAKTGAGPGTYTDNIGTVVLPTGGDGSSAWVRLYNGSIWCEWFGAGAAASASDNVTAINAAISEAKSSGKNVRIGQGQFSIDDTIEISDASGLYFIGAGDNSAVTDSSTKFVWSGANDVPALKITDSRACHVSQIEIHGTISAPLYCGVQLWWSGSGQVQFRVDLARIAVRGNGGYVGYGFRVEKDVAAPDNNNSEHVFYECGASEFGDGGGLYANPAGFVVLQTQAKALLFIRCGALGVVSSASYGFYGLGAIYWIGGGISYVSEACFFLTGPNDVTAVHGLQSEGCKALLKTANTSSGGLVDIRDMRYANDEMVSPYTLVEYKFGGTLRLESCRIGGQIIPMKIILDQFSSCVAEVHGCYMGLTSTDAADLFTLTNPGEKRISATGNIRTASGIAGRMDDFVNWNTVPNFTTANRPSSPKVGFHGFDTAINSPVWFDGSDWRNGSGTIV